MNKEDTKKILRNETCGSCGYCSLVRTNEKALCFKEIKDVIIDPRDASCEDWYRDPGPWK